MRKFLQSARTFLPGLLLLSGSVLATGQAALTAGQAAPTFTLTAQDGSSVSLSSLRGQWVVVFFYPSTTDAGSLAEAKAFESDLPQYSKSGTVLGISTGSGPLPLQFAIATGATYPLLSDPQGNTAKAFGSLAANGTATRNTFLIDPQGNIAQVWTGVAPTAISTKVKSTLSLKPPVGTVQPIKIDLPTRSLKPPVG